MKKHNILLVTVLALAFVLAGCASGGGLITPAAGNSGGPAGTPAATVPPQLDAPMLVPVRAWLADSMGLADTEILKDPEVKAVEWPNTCLGAALPGEMCAEAITPGFRLTFITPQGPIDVHTDRALSNFRLAPPAQPVAVWERTGGFAGVCERFSLAANGVYVLEDCKQGDRPAKIGILSGEAMKPLQDELARFGPTEWVTEPQEGTADMFNDRFSLAGTGSKTAAPEELLSLNEMLAELARKAGAAQWITPQSNGAPSTPAGTPAPEGQGEPAATMAPSGDSGIMGQALVGPACPGPVKVGQECPDQPYQGAFSVLNPATKQPVTQFQTDADGRFQVPLAPGTYVIHLESTDRLPRGSDLEVVVEPGQYISVTISLDSGMR